MTVVDRTIQIDSDPFTAVKQIEDYIKYMAESMQRVIDVQQKKIADLEKRLAEMESANG